MKRIISSIFILSVVFVSCKKNTDNQYNTALKGNLSVEFDNIVGSSDLQLNTATYTNAMSESFTVTKLKYYVSNFVLTGLDNTTYTVPQDSCYFLIDESITSSRKPVMKVPEGGYKALTFTIGVDSLRNTKDISLRTGVLDPATTAADMYWGWNSGYIFFKLEGTSPVIMGMGNAFQYHIGGFGGYSTPTTNNLKTVTLDLSQRGYAIVKNGKTSNLHIMVDIAKALTGTTNISFATTFMIHSIAPGKPIADNYAAMFTHDHTENQ